MLLMSTRMYAFQGERRKNINSFCLEKALDLELWPKIGKVCIYINCLFCYELMLKISADIIFEIVFLFYT